MSEIRLHADDPPAQSVATLMTSELFALATARLWIARCLNPDRPVPDWNRGFALAGLEPSSAADFDELFQAIASGARRDMEFHCPSCPRLGADEAGYLRMLALFQRGRTVEASAILEEWLAPAALRLALSPAHGFAAALAWAGLTLPLRTARLPYAAEPSCSIETDRGLHLLH